MICPPCKLAGSLMRAGKDEMAETLHRNCEGSPTWDGRPATCPCQHEVAPAEQIKAGARKRA